MGYDDDTTMSEVEQSWRDEFRQCPERYPDREPCPEARPLRRVPDPTDRTSALVDDCPPEEM